MEGLIQLLIVVILGAIFGKKKKGKGFVNTKSKSNDLKRQTNNAANATKKERKRDGRIDDREVYRSPESRNKNYTLMDEDMSIADKYEQLKEENKKQELEEKEEVTTNSDWLKIGNDEAKRAIVLSEILGKPKALR